MALNDGSRPSQLDLGRALTGEIDGVPVNDAFREAIAQAKPPAFDFAALSARAAALPDDDAIMLASNEPEPSLRPDSTRVAPAAASPRTLARPLWRRSLPALAVALSLVTLFSILPRDPNRLKGGESDLGFYVQRAGQVFPGDPSTPLRPGDAVQFTYRTQADTLVLLSVDAEGVVSTFWPAQGDDPVPVVPGERQVLVGSVVLDDAPSPEVFVGFFGDWTVSEARAAALETFADGGIEAVAQLADGDGNIATVTVEKVN